MNQLEFDGITVNAHCAIELVDCFFDQFGQENIDKGQYFPYKDIMHIRKNAQDSFVVLHEAAHSWGCCPKAYKENKVLSIMEEEAVADLCTAAILFATRKAEKYEAAFRSLRSHKLYCAFSERAIDKSYKILSKMCPRAQAFFDTRVAQLYEFERI